VRGREKDEEEEGSGVIGELLLLETGKKN